MMALWLFHVAMFSWWVDTSLVEPTSVEQAAAEVVESDAFIELVSGQIERQLENELPEGFEVPRSAIEAALRTSEVQQALFRIAGEATRAMLGHPASDVVVDLDAVRRQLIVTLQPSDPGLAVQLESVPALPALTFNPETTPLPNLESVDKWSSLAWSIPIVFSIVALAAALLLHPKPGKILRRFGIGMVMGAGAILVTSWLSQKFVLSHLPANEVLSLGRLLIVNLSQAFISQVRLQLMAGLGVAVAGHFWLVAARM